MVNVLPELMTTAQVAAETGVPESTLRWWRHCHQGPPCFKLGAKKVVYRRDAVYDWICEQESGCRSHHNKGNAMSLQRVLVNQGALVGMKNSMRSIAQWYDETMIEFIKGYSELTPKQRRKVLSQDDYEPITLYAVDALMPDGLMGLWLGIALESHNLAELVDHLTERLADPVLTPPLSDDHHG